MKYNYILFDLDGTLTDPKIGITKSVAYSLKKIKNIDEDPEKLTKFIGPPLKESYMEFYGFSEIEAEKAIEYYREYFKKDGIFENKPYEGINELLGLLHKREDTYLAVATSKPTVFAEKILCHFDLDHYFDCIVGSNLDGTRTSKADIIREVMLQLSIDEVNKVIMIGDRKHDVIGANKLNIISAGVEYGYGSYSELEEAGADYIVKDINSLKRILFKWGDLMKLIIGAGNTSSEGWRIF